MFGIRFRPDRSVRWAAIALGMVMTMPTTLAWVVADDAEQPAVKTPTEEAPAVKESPDKSGAEGKAAEKGSAGAAKKNTKAKGAGANKLADYTPEREAAALMFASLHHPELSSLLGQLKESDPQEYQRAIRELFQASERLAQIQERAPARYELELEIWKLESRIRLLAARMAMGADPALEQELRELAAEQIDARLSLAQFERREVEQRLEKLNARIDAIEKSRDDRIQQVVDRVRRDAQKARPAAALKRGAKGKRQMDKKAAAERKPAPAEDAGVEPPSATKPETPSKTESEK